MIMIQDDYQAWKKEEDIAHIHGWDFSHIEGRYAQATSLPWNYSQVIHNHLTESMRILDYDTGGGQFLLSLHHPYLLTAATEGYPPNVEICKQTLLPLGIDFRACATPEKIPFADSSFDIILNRHGSFAPHELYRLLKPNGLFITQQVGADNDRDLVQMVLPNTPKPYPDARLSIQQQALKDVGFTILRAEEAFLPMHFYDIGAFVWFARIIEWEFPGFSVDRCFDRLVAMKKKLDAEGKITGTIHRYLIVAQKA